MRSILHSLLAFAISLVYVTGSYVTVEFEHSHEVAGDHGHQHHDHGHPHDHAPAPDESGDEENGGTPHHHSHTVVLGTDVPLTSPGFAPITSVPWTSIRFRLPEPDSYPDGPCFALIKPPQLG